MNKWRDGLPHFMVVFLPYVLLFGYSGYVWAQIPDKLAHGLPRILIWVPAGLSAILPLTFGVLVFWFGEHLRRTHSLVLAVLMATALVALTVLVHLVRVVS